LNNSIGYPCNNPEPLNHTVHFFGARSLAAYPVSRDNFTMVRRLLLRYYFLALVTTIFYIILSYLPVGTLATETTTWNLSSTGSHPQTLFQQGRELYEVDRFLEAIDVLKQAAESYQTQGEQVRQAMVLSNLSLVYKELYRLPDAVQAVNESLALLNASGSDSAENSHDRIQVLAQALEIQGGLQFELGQSEQALNTWQQAERTYARLNDDHGVVRSRINQAQALQVLGFYRQALTMLTEVNQKLQTQPDSFTKAVELRSLGEILQLTGDLEQSHQVLRTSLSVAQQLQLSEEIGATLLSLGNTTKLQQDTEAAIAYYQQAAELAPALLTRVQARINQFGLQLDREWPAIETLVSEITTELASLPVSQSTVYAHIHFAQSLLRYHNSEQVVDAETFEPIAQILATAVEQARRLGDQRAEAYALGTLAGLYEQTEQWTEAETLTHQALLLAQTVNAPDVAYRWHWQLGRLLKRQENIDGAIVAYSAAIEELQSIRNDLVAMNRDVQFSFRDSVEPVYRQTVELLLQSQSLTPNEQMLDKARQTIEALQLAELDNFFREACLNAETIFLDEIVDQNNPTSAIFYPIILPEQLHVIVKIPEQPLRHYTVKRSQTEVDAIVTQLRYLITEPETLEDVKSLSQAIYQWLIQPIVSELDQSNVDTLVFILDGALRNIPMAVLYDGSQYLIEKYAIALSPSLQLLNPQPLSKERLQVLAAGLMQPPPEFQGFSPLPAIQSEFDRMSEIGILTTTLLDQNFTRQTLENQINSTPFNVIHLATHGQFSSRAEETFVLAADGPINVTQFDTFLRRRDETRPDPVELLVLSACQTAAGDHRATLGLAGVAVRAGARSTLASLWNIGDRSTSILIGEFYRELVNSKVSKAKALRRAQVTLMKNYPNYSRPSFWAAYVLIGNWL
jgi:CHAT domain-containing protein